MPNSSSQKTGTVKPAPSRCSGCPSSQPSPTSSGSIPSEVLRWCREQRLFSPGDRVLCAVSGGKDSMAMLDLLALLAPELGISLSAAHFHHGLRGAEADRDAEFVRAFCRQRGIPFALGRADAAKAAAETGQSVEQAARTLRYEFLRETAGCGKIATAHTAEDNLETVLINLLRGTGLRGLCGIPPARDDIVRPVLCLNREQIGAWLRARNLPHVEDSSNASGAYLRNRLRQNVLPLLQAEAPDLPQKLLREGALLRQDADLLDAQAETLLEEAASGPNASLCAEILLAAPEAVSSRALLRWLRRKGVRDPGQRHVAAVRRLLDSRAGSAEAFLPGGVRVVRAYGFLSAAQEALPPPREESLPLPGTLVWGAWRIETAALPSWDGTPAADGWLLSLPKETLRVRPRRTGDRLSLPGGEKSLKRLMIDKKIPAAQRDSLPVFCDGDEVVCAVGLGVSKDRTAVRGEPAIHLRVCLNLTKESEQV